MAQRTFFVSCSLMLSTKFVMAVAADVFIKETVVAPVCSWDFGFAWEMRPIYVQLESSTPSCIGRHVSTRTRSPEYI